MKLHVLNGYIQSIYLAEYPDKLLLLDGCCRADVDTVIQYIEHELGRNRKDLTLIVVTHMHPDHAGGAHRLRDLTGCKLACGNVNGQWYSGIEGHLMHWTDIALTRWVAKRQGKPAKNVWYSAKLKPDIKLNDGDILPYFDDWRIIETQGHTDRDVSLHHMPSNKIYVADLIVKVKQKYLPPYPIFYPNRYKRSLAKIYQVQADKILLAHGGELTFDQKQYEQLLQRAPSVPLTHWRSVKSKLATVLGFGQSRA